MYYAVIAVEGTDMLNQAVVVIALTGTQYRAELIAELIADTYSKAMEIETLVRDIKTGDIVYRSDTID